MNVPKQSRGLRPLTDQAREALFNILAARAADGDFLDLFAGTGAVGIEALSRGARRAVFVEIVRQFAAAIRQNLELTGFSGCAEVYTADVLSFLGRCRDRFDVIFAGAPYDDPVLEEALVKISETKILKPSGVLIAERRKQGILPEEFGELKRFREARYGETVLSFYENSSLPGKF